MKHAILLLSIASLVFSSYIDPPLGEVGSHNQNIAAGLLGFIPGTGSEIQNCTITVNPSNLAERAVKFISIRAISIFPAVDNRISADNQPKIFWSWGEQHNSDVSWKTKLGGTECQSTAQFESFRKNVELKFGFLGHKAITNVETNPAPIPDVISSEFNRSNGMDRLEIVMDAIGNFEYDLDVYSVVCTESSCSCEHNELASGRKNITISCSNTLEYAVEGGKTLRLLERPVLEEQWFRNNRFDNLLASKRKFYKGGIYLNGVEIGNFSLYSFNVSYDEYNLGSITSVWNYSSDNASVFEDRQNSSPFQMEQAKESYGWIYEINSSRYEGIGKNNLSLLVYDEFGKKFEFSNEILSRELSFGGNKTENGEIVVLPDEKTRPSLQDNQGSYELTVISAGLIGLLLVVLLYPIIGKK